MLQHVYSIFGLTLFCLLAEFWIFLLNGTSLQGHTPWTKTTFCSSKKISEEFRRWCWTTSQTKQVISLSYLSMFVYGCLWISMFKQLLAYWIVWFFTGTEQGWAIPKFQSLEHVPRQLVAYGVWENTCCQHGEHAHRTHVKATVPQTNQKDWEYQVMMIHTRNQAIHLLDKEITGKHTLPMKFWR